MQRAWDASRMSPGSVMNADDGLWEQMALGTTVYRDHRGWRDILQGWWG